MLRAGAALLAAALAFTGAGCEDRQRFTFSEPDTAGPALPTVVAALFGVVRADGEPLAGAGLQVRAQVDNRCGEGAIATQTQLTTDAEGNYFWTAEVRSDFDFTSCVQVHIEPPPGSALPAKDTVVSDVRFGGGGRPRHVDFSLP